MTSLVGMNSLLQSLPSVPNVPVSAGQYVYNDLEIKRSAVRRTVQIPSNISQCSARSNKAYFELPNTGIFDFHVSGLYFTMSVSATGGTYARVSNGIYTSINRIRLLVGSKVVEDINNYGLLHSIVNRFGNPNFTSSLGFALLGEGSQARRNTLAAGHSYFMNLILGSLAAKPLPLYLMKEKVVLEVYFDNNPSNWIETDGTNPQFNVTNLNFYCDQILFDNQYESQLKSELDRTGSIVLPYVSWENYDNTMTSATSNSLQIPCRKKSLKNMMSVMRTSSTLSDTTVNDKFEVYNNTNITLNCVNFQSKINNDFYPQVATQASNEDPQAYVEMLKLLSFWQGYAPEEYSNAVSQNFWIDKFAMCVNLTPEKISDDFNDFENTLSGVNTSDNSSTVLMNIQLAAVGFVTQSLSTFCFFDALWMIDRDGVSHIRF